MRNGRKHVINMGDFDLDAGPAARSRSFPVDLQSVRDVGVTRWRQECSRWPVGDSEHLDLIGEIQEAFWTVVGRCSHEVADALTVLFKLIIEYELVVHTSMMVDRLRREGMSVMCHDTSWYYNEIMSDTPDIDGLFSRYRHKLWPHLPTFKERCFGKAKTLLISARYQRRNLAHFMRSFAYAPCRSLVGYPSADVEALLRGRKNSVRFRYPFSLFPERSSLSVTLRRECEEAVDHLLNEVRRIARAHGTELKVSHVTYLREISTSYLIGTIRSIEETWRSLKKRRAGTLLFRSLGGTNVRSICAAGKRAGHEIIGSTHSNDIAIHKGRWFGVLDLSLVDTYVVPTRGVSKLYRKIKRGHEFVAERDIDFVSIDSDRYKKLRETHNRRPRPRTIESVMVVEYPLTDFRHNNVFAFWPYQLDLTLRVGDMLKKQGVRAILKRHPDRLRDSEGLYGGSFDRMVSEPFETVFEMADAYLFTNLATTTFGFALSTNRPILFFETLLEDVWEELHDPLRKRCRVIPSWIDRNGQLSFDTDAFVDALQTEPEEPDGEFFEAYMCP